MGLVGVLAVALVWVVYGTLEAPVVVAGDKAPDFTVVTEDGKTVTPKDFGGKLLVLNFWASWCAPCIEETPSLNAFQQLMAPKGVVVLAVSVDTNEKLYREFLNRFDVKFQTSRDPEANISARYGTYVYPESYLITPDGRVAEKIVGVVSNSSGQQWMDPEFVAHIQKML
jgi:peroxiredoxin